jgi:hypothetical protein
VNNIKKAEEEAEAEEEKGEDKRGIGGGTLYLIR